MNEKAGVWVDHRKAVVVRFSESGEEVVHVNSGAESQLRRSSEHPTGNFEPLQVPADDTQQHKYMAELNKFYDEVISHVSSAKSILICGPGEAKKELKNRMAEKLRVTENVVLETADIMTDAQVVAKIRQHFHAG